MATASNVLIITSDTGGGHRSAARALEDSFNVIGDSTGEIVVKIRRILEHASLSTRHLGDLYNYLLRNHQDLMKYYFSFINHCNISESKLLIKMALNYTARVLENHTPDVIVSVHPMTQHLLAAAMSRIKILGDIPLVTVVTDPCGGFWKGWACDEVKQYYVASSEARQQLIDFGVEKRRIDIVGMPIARKFHPVDEIQKVSLRSQWDLHPEKFTVFVNAGWIGGGNIPKIYRAMAESDMKDIQVVFLAGKNKGLKKQAEAMAQRSGTDIKVLGFTPNIDELMKTSDVMVSKLGGLTTFEAMSTGLPIIADSITPPMPQEAETATFIKAKGCGELLYQPNDVVSVIESLLISPTQHQEMREAALLHGSSGASDKIAQDILTSYC